MDLQSFPSYTLFSSRRTTSYSTGNCRPLCMARLKRDIRRWCRECQSCQAAKVHRHIRAPLSHRSQPTGRFHSIHVDLVGPLPPSEGMTYLFIIIDRFTRWLEAIPFPDAKTSTCTNALIRGWISRFGRPENITSDQGRQFTSSLWSNLNKMLGIKQQHTTAYHPQANGMVERLHPQLKDFLKACTAPPYWMEHRPFTFSPFHFWVYKQLGVKNGLRN